MEADRARGSPGGTVDRQLTNESNLVCVTFPINIVWFGRSLEWLEAE